MHGLLHGLLIFPFYIAPLSAAQSASAEESLQQLIQRAHQLKLAEHPDWLNLLHYKQSASGRLYSQADDERFFLAENGAEDAWAELQASLQVFYHPTENADAVCRFPARLHWLSIQLGQQLKESSPGAEQTCEDYLKWKQRFQTSSGLTLLFPGMYLNNPASMFGHTFLRFDENRKSPLLSQTLSYAASHDEEDSFVTYAWKGITGGYDGRFFMRPYYETLLEYSDIEQRDIWEYSLNLSAEEIEQLVRHLWEVKGIHFEYFFLRENCSYRLLALLDVARPGINMSLDSHPVYALPVDIVRDVERAGLISGRLYRPAMQSRLLQMTRQLGDKGTRLAKEVADGSLSVTDVNNDGGDIEKARILKLADQFISYKDNTQSNDTLQFDILSELSRLGLQQSQVDFKFTAEPPESGHSSARIQLSAGQLEDIQYYELGLRPVFHDSLDDARGFIHGSSVNVLETRLRWSEDRRRLKLQSIDLFSMRSLLPVRDWDYTSSKSISFSLQRIEWPDTKSDMTFISRLAIGYTAQMSQFTLFAMLDGELDYSPGLEDHHVAYLGGQAGLLWQARSKDISAQLELSSRVLQQVSGQEGDKHRHYAGLQINSSKDRALRFEYTNTDYSFFEVEEISLSALFYF